MSTTKTKKEASSTTDREIVISRLLDAPRELVFKAWTDPNHVTKWWGPDGFTNTIHEMDVRAGGVFRVTMHGPNGVDYPAKSVFTEVIKPERLAYTHSGDGSVDLAKFHTTVTFAQKGNQTDLTMRSLFATAEERDRLVTECDVIEGGNQMLGHLAEYLATMSDAFGIDTPQIIQTPLQSTVVIHITVARSEIRNVMGPSHRELLSTLAAQGIEPIGPWFTHHLKRDPATFDFELGVPVDKPVTHLGRVTNGHLPAGTVARTIYHGDYEGLPGAWGEFNAWIVAQGHTPGPSLWETYLTDPASSPDPATWRTELNWPLLK